MTLPPAPGPVLVMGAGSVGCWVGGCLAAAGHDVRFVGRPRMLQALRAQGLRLTSLDGTDLQLAPDRLQLADRLVPCAPALVLLCVKSAATAEAAAQLAAALPDDTPVLSLQNGVSNVATATRAAPRLRVLAGMVPYNVAEQSPGHLHRGTSGELAAQDHPALRRWQPLFKTAGVPLQLHADLRPLQWGKLLLNLNNPVNALSGLPLRQQLLDRSLRRVTAALQDEALAVLHASGMRPARLTPLPPERVPQVLRLPTPLFRLLAARMLRVDPRARSSMADDLALGRPTEVAALCGEIVRLAQGLQAGAPLNARMVQLVEGWPADPRPRSGAELMTALGLH